jgi:hypothetical protein
LQADPALPNPGAGVPLIDAEILFKEPEPPYTHIGCDRRSDDPSVIGAAEEFVILICDLVDLLLH